MSDSDKEELWLAIGSSVVAILFFAGFIFMAYTMGRREGRNEANSASAASVDTLIIRDTVTAEKAVYLTRRVVDTVRIRVTDTVRVTDTLFVMLPREQICWADTLCEVYASGVAPAVDSVRHFITEREVTKVVTQKQRTHWGLGVTAGYGATFRDGVQLSPFVGVGVSYNFVSW